MAGHRKGTGRRRQSHARLVRRRAALAEKLAAAPDAAARVGITADYLRSALKRADPDTADRAAAEACEVLRHLADRLAAEPRRETPVDNRKQ